MDPADRARIAALEVVDTTNVVTLTFPGVTLEVDLAQLDGLDWRDAKAVTGLHDTELVVHAVKWRDRDATAALAWVWLRRDDPEITYEQTLRHCHYGPPPDDEDELEQPEVEQPASPEESPPPAGVREPRKPRPPGKPTTAAVSKA